MVVQCAVNADSRSVVKNPEYRMNVSYRVTETLPVAPLCVLPLIFDLLIFR